MILTPDEKSLALATRRAVQAAGGLETCRRETGLSTSQLSRCESGDHRDSITLRDAVTIDALGRGCAGFPHILAAYGRQLGFIVIGLPEGPEDADGLMQSVVTLASELGDVAASIRDGLRDDVMSPPEARDALEQLDGLDQTSAALRLKLRALADVRTK